MIGSTIAAIPVTIGAIATIRAGGKNAQAAADQVTAHLDNGIKSAMHRLDAKLTEIGITVDAVVKTQERPIIRTDSRGLLTYANPAATDIIGLTQGEMAGNGWVRGILDEDRMRVVTEWQNAVRLKIPFGPIAYHYKHPMTGKITLVEATADPVVTDEGEVISWVAVIQPID